MSEPVLIMTLGREEFLARIAPSFQETFGRLPRLPLDPGASTRILIERNGEMAGWHFGAVLEPRVYEMRNTAVLPRFRRQGVYRCFAAEWLRLLRASGIDEVVSRHRPGNEAILAAKHAQGFEAVGREIDPALGELIRLRKVISLPHSAF